MKWLVCICFFSTSFLYAQDAREIINRYLDTVSNGNIENWNKIKSMYIEGESFYSQQSYDQQINFSQADKSSFTKHFVFPPYGSRIDSYADSVFSELKSSFYFLEDKTIIVLGNMPPIINRKTRKPDEPNAVQTPVFIHNLVLKSTAIQMMGVEEFPLDATWCYRIRVTAKGRDYDFYINTETYLLDYSDITPGEDGSLAKFYNYKKIGEFLMPTSTCAMKKGVIYQSWNKTKIELNPELDPGIFKYKEEK